MSTIRKILLPIGALALAAAIAAGCGSTSKATAAQPIPPTASAIQIEITSFGPSGRNVNVDFQATNNTGSDQRFTWADYVLTAPDGSHHVAYRDPGSAPYDMVDSDGGSFVSGGVFQFPTFMSGQYQISYAGKVLQTATL